MDIHSIQPHLNSIQLALPLVKYVSEMHCPKKTNKIMISSLSVLNVLLCENLLANTHNPNMTRLLLVMQVDSMEVEETGIYFVELVQRLIKDTAEREHFFQVRKIF